MGKGIAGFNYIWPVEMDNLCYFCNKNDLSHDMTHAHNPIQSIFFYIFMLLKLFIPWKKLPPYTLDTKSDRLWNEPNEKENKNKVDSLLNFNRFVYNGICR